LERILLKKEPLAELMIHPSSPLIPYYPPDFTSDPNGKRQAWEAVVDLPFIEAGVLLDTVNRVLEQDNKDGSKLLSPAERRRNIRGKDHFFVPRGLGANDQSSLPLVQGKTATQGQSSTTSKAKGVGVTAPKKRVAKPESAKKAASPKTKKTKVSESTE
jgi:5'-3' exonuclease